LSGGTFQNKYLLETLENKLAKDNFTVFTHSRVPCNDGGIALGQLAVAARIKG
jgi:hydrogenase maturation protein HypF